MTPSDNRRWALVGPLAVALWVAGLILLTHNGPADHATGSEILAWYRSDTNTILLGGWFFMLGCLAFVTLVSGVRVRLADALGASSQLPGLALAGAAIAGVCGMLTAAVDVGGAIDKNDIDPSTAATFHHLLDVFFVGASLGAILPLAAVAIVAWRTRILPRWWAGFSALVAVILVIGPIGWAGLIFGVRRADLDARHEPVRAPALARAHAGGRGGRLSRRGREGRARGRRAPSY